MPRTKGSKNKNSLTVEEQIAKVTAEIEELKAAIDAKKAEIKELNGQKKAEDEKKLLAAFYASGKSIDDVLAYLAQE